MCDVIVDFVPIFISERQTVELPVYMLKGHKINARVPQGSPPSSIPCLLYNSDLLNMTTDLVLGSSSIGYVDDFA